MKEDVTILVPTPEKISPIQKNLIFIFFIIIVSFLSIWIGLLQFQMPRVISQSASIEQFSGERAMKYLENIAVKPRPIGSTEHDRVRDYLVSELTNLGVSPEIQVADENLAVWGGPYEGKVENIIARIPGEDSSGAIMITSHYDSEVNSPGAADAGSGVAAILETVRALTESTNIKNDVIILISDGEEIGLLGAQAFVKYHPWAKDVGIVLNFEARGSSGPSVLFETNDGNERLIAEFIRGASNPIAHSFIYDLYKKIPNNTDLSVYKASGMYGLNFGFFEELYSYHTSKDTIENLNLNSLQHHGENMLDLVRHYGKMNLVAKKDEGNKVYFNVIGKQIVAYSEQLVIPLMGLAIICFAITIIHGFKRKKLTAQGIVVGFFLFLMMICLAYFLGYGFWNYLPFILPQNSWLMQLDLRISHPLLIGLIFIIFAIFSLIYRLVLKKVNVSNLTTGAFFVWLILVIFTSLLMKGSSNLFIWPTIIGIVGINILLSLKDETSLKSKIITTVFASPVLILTAPSLYLAYMLLSLQSVGILLAFTTLLGAFIIPLLTEQKRQRG